MVEPDTIYVLGGGLIHENGVWRTTHFDEQGDAFGALGDKLRVEAAAVLFSQYPDTQIVVSGGKGQLRDNPDAPTIASVLKMELIQLGVPEASVLEEADSDSTYQQLQQLKRLCSEHNWHQVDIVTNTWHMPRTIAFLENDPALNNLIGRGIHVVSAEEVLVAHDREKWEAYIHTAYHNDAMKERYEKEERGIVAIKNGTYVFR